MKKAEAPFQLQTDKHVLKSHLFWSALQHCISECPPKICYRIPVRIGSLMAEWVMHFFFLHICKNCQELREISRINLVGSCYARRVPHPLTCTMYT